jgi:hypothetical protein
MVRSARIATEFVWNIDTTEVAVGAQGEVPALIVMPPPALPLWPFAYRPLDRSKRIADATASPLGNDPERRQNSNCRKSGKR